MMVISSSTMVCRDASDGTSSYCYLLLCCMKGNAANFCGVILIIEHVMLIHVIMSMVIQI